MYCPKCSQPQVSDQVQFCSRCGVPLNSIKEVTTVGGKVEVGQPKASEESPSPRQQGVRHGVKLMILSVILIPAYILLAALFPAHDRLVESAVSDTPFEKISQAILFTIFLLGLARVLYARFFQAGSILEESQTEDSRLPGSTANYALPPAQSIPVSDFGAWRTNTGEIVESRRVTKHTTKSLDKE